MVVINHCAQAGDANYDVTAATAATAVSLTSHERRRYYDLTQCALRASVRI